MVTTGVVEIRKTVGAPAVTNSDAIHHKGSHALYVNVNSDGNVKVNDNDVRNRNDNGGAVASGAGWRNYSVMINMELWTRR